MKLVLLFLLIQFEAHSLIPIVHKLPEHKSYFKNYYKHFNSWFNRHIYSWEKQHQLNLELSEIKHWYITTADHKRFYYQWGIAWDPKTSSVFYTLNKTINANSFKTLSTIKSYECQESVHQLKCSDQQLVIKKSPKKLPLNFPLSSKGIFYFQDFITDSRAYYQGDELKRIYFNLNDIQVNWLPKELQELIKKIGLETRLPTDKLSIDNDGRVIVYYP